MSTDTPLRLFLIVLLAVWACCSFIGFAVAKTNPLLGVIVDKVMTEVDANGDHKVTRAEFASARSLHFYSADQNHDGYVTREEFSAELATVAGEFGLVWGDQLFNVLDRDSDNLLARDEVNELAETAFTQADHNSDGFVTPAEVHPSLALAR